MLDMVRARANPGDVERLLLETAKQDGTRVRIGFGQDPGQAGKSQAHHLVRALNGFTVTPAPESGDKLTRFGSRPRIPCFEHLERTCTPAGRPRRKSRGRLRFERQYRD